MMQSLQCILRISLCIFVCFVSVEAIDKIEESEEEIGYSQAIEVKKHIFSKQSKYQSIEVHEADYYGKILILDGVMQLTERDASAYNEMMAHMALMQHKKPKRALVIGGGDGYVVSEVLKHDSIEHVDHVDLDRDVIEACKEHFSWGAAWDDPRVTLHIADGAAFVEKTPNASYDIVIQDSSDPFTTDDSGEMVILPSHVLYTEKHVTDIYRILTPNGIFNFQAETFNIPSDLEGIVEWRKQALSVGFRHARYGSLYISTYPTGQIGFLLCEKKPSESASMEEITDRFTTMEKKGRGTEYYQPKLQQSSFDLPYWVEKIVYANESSYSKDEL